MQIIEREGRRIVSDGRLSYEGIATVEAKHEVLSGCWSVIARDCCGRIRATYATRDVDNVLWWLGY